MTFIFGWQGQYLVKLEVGALYSHPSIHPSVKAQSLDEVDRMDLQDVKALLKCGMAQP